MTSKNSISKTGRLFTTTVLIMAIVGYLVFLSAVLGRVGQDLSGFTLIALKQLIILVIALGAFLVASQIPFNFWRKYSLPLFIIGLLTTLAVFIPMIGIESGGAKRWVAIGPFSFQTSELLKLGFVLYLAGWLTTFKNKVHTVKYGLIPVVVMLGLAIGTLILQPDTGTSVVIAAAGIAMFMAAGAKWQHIGMIIVCSLIGLAVLAFFKPYIKDRIMTYINPSDEQGSAYQINQSLIAIGSGGLMGRGFGQSLQKFNFLPQPIGDSIFSVAAEEFGFIGGIVIITLFVAYALWGLKIANQASSVFGRLLAIGIVILIVSQSFINIGAMIAVFPLTGIPLVFFSQGGSALLLALFESGIIRNISKHT